MISKAKAIKEMKKYIFCHSKKNWSYCVGRVCKECEHYVDTDTMSDACELAIHEMCTVSDIMTIQEVADELNMCANKECEGCRFQGMYNCRDEKVKEMGEEVRKIAEQMKGETK